jgi:hypothetical protein
VQPGLTGWAQVKYRYGSSVEDALREAALRPLLHQAPVDRLRPDDSDRHAQGDRVAKRGEVSATADFHEIAADADQTRTVARNVSTRYLAIAVEAILGFVVLPFNIAHLGRRRTACGC